MLNKTVDFYVKLLGQGWLRFIFKENVFKNILKIYRIFKTTQRRIHIAIVLIIVILGSLFHMSA